MPVDLGGGTGRSTFVDHGVTETRGEIYTHDPKLVAEARARGDKVEWTD